MATGVKPREEDVQFSRTDLEAIQEAMKNKKFRELLAEYCDEMRDPASQALYQKEMTQLEKERGYDVTFINPKGGYVIKTSVAGDRKAFINICSNGYVGKPSCNIKVIDGKKGMNWLIPYSLIPPREDYDAKRQKCVIYDVVFHPDTLRMADQNKQFRELVNNTAFDALKKTYNIHLDSNNLRFPKSLYKGMANPAVIRKEDPDYQPPTEEETEHLSPEIMEKLYPQHNYQQTKPDNLNEKKQSRKNEKNVTSEFRHSTKNGYTVPKYIIKQQKNVDLQEYTFHKDSKQHSAIPSYIILEIYLPLLNSTKDCTLDVEEKHLYLVSEKPAKYKLDINLPYAVNDQCGTAKFDKSKHTLVVSLPVIRQHYASHNSLKVDSGVESEENSGSSDDDKEKLVEELSSTPAEVTTAEPQTCESNNDLFINPSLAYTLPEYTHNALDDTVAFTFHVKNTEPDSVKVKQDENKIYIKFTTVGSGFVPVYYAAIIIFDENSKFENVSGEAWDNNVILQMDVVGELPKTFQIGLNEESLVSEHFNVSPEDKVNKLDMETASDNGNKSDEVAPVIAVNNRGSETNIVVSSNDQDEDDDDEEESPSNGREIVWAEGTHNVSSAKSILRKSLGRSYSESSMGDVASSMDYISSDCIPEESSLKKTVRFNNVIARKFYRYNSSIEGQKKKNQRKKSKKRSQERRKSESEADDEHTNESTMPAKPKSVLKKRCDSGLADTSDADTDFKNTPDQYSCSQDNNWKPDSNKSVLNIVGNSKSKPEPTIWESDKCSEKEREGKAKPNPPINCDNIKHNTNLYDPDKLNPGKNLEVKFKNDLIFDLDM
ncbi:unnamed protein product [Plutella xylostella]|uniref:Protein kintoun n=1 Tax=Plutella xylostella TaxID=51655 RepID=A0A8S4DF67_PLUXY|nr:unnamed protein product [Plutella xylostella]